MDKREREGQIILWYICVVERWLKANLCVCGGGYVLYMDDLYAGFLLYEICGCFLLNEKDKSIFCIYPRILASLSLATARAF